MIGVEQIIDAIRVAAHGEVHNHAVLAATFDMHVVFNPTGKGAGGLDSPEFLPCFGLIDNVQLALKNETGGWRDGLMANPTVNLKSL